jgi:hypothetical protein
VDSEKDDLVSQLRETAHWRARKAEEHPEDERHAQSAAALTRAADDIAAMSYADPRLQRLASTLAMEDEDVVASYIVRENELIAGHGCDDPEATTDQLLDSLVEATRKAILGIG